MWSFWVIANQLSTWTMGALWDFMGYGWEDMGLPWEHRKNIMRYNEPT